MSKIKVLSPREMLKARIQSSEIAKTMSHRQVMRQFRFNGSVPTPNPWYDPKAPKLTDAEREKLVRKLFPNFR